MKGSMLVAVLSVLVFQAAADFGPWSPWGECECDLKRYRSRECEVEPCVGDYVDTKDCPCVPLKAAADCPMVVGADSLYAIVPDPCNCMDFYLCEYDPTTKKFIGLKRMCSPCMVWQPDYLTCVRDEWNENCTTSPPTTQEIGPCSLTEVPGHPEQFMLDNQIMNCAPGTVFNLTLCGCGILKRPISGLKEITSVMFDDNSTITASKGIWLYNHNVELRNDSCVSGKCGYFNSSLKAKLEIPMFSAAFSQFGAFSVRVFFKRTAGIYGVRSLVDNSECTLDGSIVAQSDVDAALGYFTNEDSKKVDFSVDVAEDTWYQLVMSYDGDYASFYLNKDLITIKQLGGKLNGVKAPIVIGGCICGGDCFFDGYIDSLCFYRGLLGMNGVSLLYDAPDRCVPW